MQITCIRASASLADGWLAGWSSVSPFSAPGLEWERRQCCDFRDLCVCAGDSLVGGNQDPAQMNIDRSSQWWAGQGTVAHWQMNWQPVRWCSTCSTMQLARARQSQSRWRWREWGGEMVEEKVPEHASSLVSAVLALFSALHCRGPLLVCTLCSAVRRRLMRVCGARAAWWEKDDRNDEFRSLGSSVPRLSVCPKRVRERESALPANSATSSFSYMLTQALLLLYGRLEGPQGE